MSNVPTELLAHIKELEQQFTVDTPKLLQIVDRFQSELEKGLTVEGGSIVRRYPPPCLPPARLADPASSSP